MFTVKTDKIQNRLTTGKLIQKGQTEEQRTERQAGDHRES